MRLGRDEVNPVGHATDIFTEWAIEYLAERKGQPEPFFLYLAYNAPDIPTINHRQSGCSAGWIPKLALPVQRGSGVAAIEHLDNGIGQVMQALEDNGQRDNNAHYFRQRQRRQLDVGANNGPLRAGKGQMWEEGVRVPAVASWSGHIEAGTTTSAVFMTMDIFATVLEAAGIDYAGEVEAQSFLPVLLGKTTAAAPRYSSLYAVNTPQGCTTAHATATTSMCKTPPTNLSRSTISEMILPRPPISPGRSPPSSCS